MRCPATLGETSPTVFDSPAAPMLSLTRALGLNLLFFLGICAAWAWFNVAPPTPTHAYRFLIKTNLPGWQFEPIPLNAKVIETLATTHLLNGVFHGPNGERINIFLGEWHADKVHDLSVVTHTPDVCWTRVGWIPSTSEKTPKVSLQFPGVEIPFETRIFKSPNGVDKEMVIWCIIVNGTINTYSISTFIEKSSFPAPSLRIPTESARKIAELQFANAVQSRTKGAGLKQFIRMSAPQKTDLASVVRDLQAFGQEWLQIQNTQKQLKKI